MLLTEYEMWMEIAIHTENAGVLPTYRKEVTSYGLCEVLVQIWLADLINYDVFVRMLTRLDMKYCPSNKGIWDYFWPIKNINARIRACKTLAKESLY